MFMQLRLLQRTGKEKNGVKVMLQQSYLHNETTSFFESFFVLAMRDVGQICWILFPQGPSQQLFPPSVVFFYLCVVFLL